jgi:hypothetical protein
VLHVQFLLLTVAIAVGLFVAMLIALELGRRFGVRQAARRGADARVGVGVVDSAVYGLLALLLGFTFSGAAQRFDHRRELIAEQVNATGTAWQRLDLLSPDQQTATRDAFRRYVDALIAWYGEAPGSLETVHEPKHVTQAMNNLWSLSAAACLTKSGEPARVLLLPALNDMFGAVDRERLARRIHPPAIVFVMLGIAALATALFAGYGLSSSKTRNWIYIIGLAAAVSIATYVILELEYPRLGLFRVNDMDQALVELRSTMQ